jgi:hypothetical protein
MQTYDGSEKFAIRLTSYWNIWVCSTCRYRQMLFCTHLFSEEDAGAGYHVLGEHLEE